MARFIFACLLIGSWCHAAVASEPPPPPRAAQYAAKITFLRVDGGKQIIAVNTEVTGTKGTPLKTNLGGKDGLVLKLDMRDVPGGVPPQYLVQFKLVETKNGKEIVLSAPTITTTAGKPAKLMVGQEKGDRIEVDLVVREIAAASSAVSGHPNKSPSQIIMGGVTPRIIIQEEEEEKLGITAPP